MKNAPLRRASELEHGKNISGYRAPREPRAHPPRTPWTPHRRPAHTPRASLSRPRCEANLGSGGSPPLSQPVCTLYAVLAALFYDSVSTIKSFNFVLLHFASDCELYIPVACIVVGSVAIESYPRLIYDWRTIGYFETVSAASK